MTDSTRRRTPNLFAAVLVTALLSAGCATSTAPSGPAGEDGATGEVTLVTHDSFQLPDDVLAEFTARTGLRVTTVTMGDGGELATKLALTPGRVPGDVAYGVDNTYADRPVQAGAFEPYTSPAAANGADRYALPGTPELTAIDHGDVCINIDTGYFRAASLPAPRTYEDLADPRYRNLLVVENPQTASPGMAFLAGTVAHFGDGWVDYWRALKANGATVVADWTTAYSHEFSGSAGRGPKPIVVSYASSPAAEISGGSARTAALLKTCFQQVEYAGLLRGAENADGGRKLIDFLLSARAQAAIPEAMYVYPVTAGVPLPANWQRFAPAPEHPATLPAGTIAAERDGWIKQWQQVMAR